MPTMPPREPTWDEINDIAPSVLPPLERHTLWCTRAQYPVLMDPQPDVLFLAYQCPECGVIAPDDEPVPEPTQVLPSMVSTNMFHGCGVSPVLLDPQPKGYAWLIYECPKCHKMSTSNRK